MLSTNILFCLFDFQYPVVLNLLSTESFFVLFFLPDVSLPPPTVENDCQVCMPPIVTSLTEELSFAEGTEILDAD